METFGGFLFGVFFTGCLSLGPGDVYYVGETRLKPNEIQLTNGAVYIRFVQPANDGLPTCYLSRNQSEISALMDNPNGVVKAIGESKFLEAMDFCVMDSDNRSRRAPGTDMPPDLITPSAALNGSEKKKGLEFIYPGTNWCGKGNRAITFYDLGRKEAVDRCCRTHDICPFSIEAFKIRFHLKNPYPWTISYCSCDRSLYTCLKKVDNPTSSHVGLIFFGLLNVDCFRFDYGSYCVRKGRLIKLCQKKTFGLKATLSKLRLDDK